MTLAKSICRFLFADSCSHTLIYVSQRMLLSYRIASERVTIQKKNHCQSSYIHYIFGAASIVKCDLTIRDRRVTMLTTKTQFSWLEPCFRDRRRSRIANSQTIRQRMSFPYNRDRSMIAFSFATASRTIVTTCRNLPSHLPHISWTSSQFKPILFLLLYML